MILWELKEEAKRIQQEMNALVCKYAPFPNEKLICTQNRKYFKYYQSDGRIRTYISNKQMDIACVLAAKEYYERLGNKYNHIQTMIAYYERHIEQDQASIDALFAPDSGYRPLLESTSDTKDFATWAREDYPTNPYLPEQKKFRTQTGIYVRSKSEKIAADTITSYGLSYRYEAPLRLDHTIYPDFTIIHPVTEELYYYEHFGMVDDDNYRKQMLRKIDGYVRYDIDHFIYTTETKERPLTIEQVEQALLPIFWKPFAQAS